MCMAVEITTTEIYVLQLQSFVKITVIGQSLRL